MSAAASHPAHPARLVSGAHPGPTTPPAPAVGPHGIVVDDRDRRGTRPGPPPAPARGPDGILFDLDGTLVDTIGLIIASFQYAVRAVLGADLDATTARSWIGRPLLPVLLDLSPEHGAEIDRVYREWNLAHTAEYIRPYAGVSAMLAGLATAGRPIAIVTSKRRVSAELALASVGLTGAIPIAMTLEDTQAHKPDPEPLLAGATWLGIPAGRCAYVGDATVDVLAARAAGMTAVAVTWGAGEREALVATGPDLVCDSVGELAAYLGVGTTV